MRARVHLINRSSPNLTKFHKNKIVDSLRVLLDRRKKSKNLPLTIISKRCRIIFYTKCHTKIEKRAEKKTSCAAPRVSSVCNVERLPHQKTHHAGAPGLSQLGGGYQKLVKSVTKTELKQMTTGTRTTATALPFSSLRLRGSS